jgi:hypothetical protein
VFSIFKKDTAPKRRFTHLQIFTIEVPESWRQNDNPKYLALSDPAGVAAITGNAFAKKERGSVTDFAESRFGAVAEMEFYSQTGDESRLRVNGHDFIIREYEGTWPEETEPTYYVLACGELDRAYVSLTVTTSPEDFQRNEKLYLEIITSTESASGSVR